MMTATTYCGSKTGKWVGAMSQPPPARRGVRRLRLYVAGQSAGGRRASLDRKRLMEVMRGAVEIEVVDILTNPAKRSGLAFWPHPRLQTRAAIRPPAHRRYQ
ncbi:hypothetical protein F2981_32590 (plasmid) [Sinorhizobium meliloti]|nr:hypothetical protein [Sinorhizobium meliloti]